MTQHAGEHPDDARTQRALVIGEALIDVVARADGSREDHPGAARRTSLSGWAGWAVRWTC